MRENWKWFVYIIECKDGTYYTGLTWKPELRYDQHLSGLGGKYTAEHGVKRVAYIEEHIDLETARIRERQIKDWSRKKKERLISGEWSGEFCSRLGQKKTKASLEQYEIITPHIFRASEASREE